MCSRNLCRGPSFTPRCFAPDPAQTLEQHLRAGLPLDLSLDLVLNDLVARAAQATHATAAALALVRGEEMVCRAATGYLAPDLGIPINTRDGLSGACLQTRQPQLSVDTEFDPASIPPFPAASAFAPSSLFPYSTATTANTRRALNSQESSKSFPPLLPPSPAPTKNCSKVSPRSAPAFAIPPSNSRSASPSPRSRPSLLHRTAFHPRLAIANSLSARRPPYETWTLVLGSLAILAIITVSFLIGSRIGWLRPTPSRTAIARPIPQEAVAPAKPIICRPPGRSQGIRSVRRKQHPRARQLRLPAPDELVVSEKGKVIFRMKPASTKPERAKNREAKPASQAIAIP